MREAYISDSKNLELIMQRLETGAKSITSTVVINMLFEQVNWQNNLNFYHGYLFEPVGASANTNEQYEIDLRHIMFETVFNTVLNGHRTYQVILVKVAEELKVFMGSEADAIHYINDRNNRELIRSMVQDVLTMSISIGYDFHPDSLLLVGWADNASVMLVKYKEIVNEANLNGNNPSDSIYI